MIGWWNGAYPFLFSRICIEKFFFFFLIEQPTQWDGNKNDTETPYTGHSIRSLERRGSINYEQTEHRGSFVTAVTIQQFIKERHGIGQGTGGLASPREWSWHLMSLRSWLLHDWKHKDTQICVEEKTKFPQLITPLRKASIFHKAFFLTQMPSQTLPAILRNQGSNIQALKEHIQAIPLSKLQAKLQR